METQYGEHYAQKVEDRLLHYLHELETVLPGDTYIDKVCVAEMYGGILKLYWLWWCDLWAMTHFALKLEAYPVFQRTTVSTVNATFWSGEFSRRQSYVFSHSVVFDHIQMCELDTEERKACDWRREAIVGSNYLWLHDHSNNSKETTALR